MARPHEQLSSTDTDRLKAMLITAAMAVEEAEALEQVCAISVTNPLLAKAMLLNADEGIDPDESHYPMARKRIGEQVEILIAADHDASVLARRLVEVCEAFRRSPGLYMAGAMPADGIAFMGRGHDMDGWLTVNGETAPWVFASAGVGKTTIFEVKQYLARAGLDFGIVVGTHLKEGVVLPPEIAFVEIDYDTVALNAGRRA